MSLYLVQVTMEGGIRNITTEGKVMGIDAPTQIEAEEIAIKLIWSTEQNHPFEKEDISIVEMATFYMLGNTIVKED